MTRNYIACSCAEVAALGGSAIPRTSQYEIRFPDGGGKLASDSNLTGTYGPGVYLAGTTGGQTIHLAGTYGPGVYLAGTTGGQTIHLAGTYAEGKDPDSLNLLFSLDWNMLESFYYIKPWQVDWIKTRPSQKFLLDSGAFTFMNSKQKVVNNLDEYVKKYVDFINKNNIKQFFEMDVDAVRPLSTVEKYRDYIEQETKTQSIPVWHKSRGLTYFEDMCKDYPYVAIGGIVTKEIPKSKFAVFNHLIKIAHHHGARIHGLGIGSPSTIKKYPFDSVDSSSWNSCAFGGGHVFQFKGGDIIKVPFNSSKKYDRHKVVRHNFTEWVKFSHYLEHQHVYSKEAV